MTEDSRTTPWDLPSYLGLGTLDEGSIHPVEDVLVCDLDCLIKDLAPAVDLVCRSGVIPPEKEHRLAVMDSAASTSNVMGLHLGEEGRDALAFSVMPILEGGPDLQELTRVFIKLSRAFLEDMRRGPMKRG